MERVCFKDSHKGERNFPLGPGEGLHKCAAGEEGREAGTWWGGAPLVALAGLGEAREVAVLSRSVQSAGTGICVAWGHSC